MAAASGFPRSTAHGRVRAPVLLAVAAFVMLASVAVLFYLNSEGYVAGRNLERAAELDAEGGTGEALELYALVADGTTDRVPEARQQMERVIRGALDGGTRGQVMATLSFAHRRRAGGALPLADFVEVAIAAAGRRAGADAATAIDMVERLRVLAPESGDAIEAARSRLLEAAVVAHPGEPRYAVELALVLEAVGDVNRAVVLVGAHRDALGRGEGARILGQHEMARGEYDAAYALLQPYVEQRLEVMRTTEASHEEQYDTLWDAEIAKLNDGQGPQSFYDAWDAAGEEERQQLVQEYVRGQLDGNADLELLRQRWQEAAAVVPLALDVGTLMLYRAQGLVDAGARKAQLEKAEATFLAVQGVAGESERFRKTLGQVYYWLGKHDDGQAQFDTLLVDRARSPDTLLELSEIYRELGLREPALALAEEAYTGAASDELRYRAAQKCATLVAGVDDELIWLQRADPGNQTVQAVLAEARARKASDEGRIDEAAEQLRKAIDIYGKQVRDGTNSNNFAVAAFSLQRIAPDPALLAEGRERMMLAVTLSPSNSIVLANAVENLLESALDEFLDRELDLSALEWEPEYDYFKALWNSQQEHAAMMARFSEVPGVRELRTYLAKALVLRPKDLNLYQLAQRFYFLERDENDLRRFAQQLRAADHDRSGYARNALQYYLGAQDAEALPGAGEDYAYWAGAFEARSKGRTSLQRTLILSEYVESAVRAARLGVAVDAKPLVAAAEALDDKRPSRLSRDLVATSLLLDVFQEVSDAGTLADALRGCPRCLRPDRLVALAASEASPLGERVRAHPSTRRAAERLAKDIELHAPYDSVVEWTLLARIAPGAAERLAGVLRNSATVRAINDVLLLRYPNYPEAIYTRALLAHLRGKSEEAAAAMKAFDAHGLAPPVTLPI